jgi:hypothetical protein
MVIIGENEAGKDEKDETPVWPDRTTWPSKRPSEMLV